VISASKMGKFKMLAQVITVALLIVSSVAGKPPVANFGRPFPAIRIGHIGRPAAAQGAAQLRMYRRYYSRELAHMDDS